MSQELEQNSVPEPVLKGRFAIYETPDGGFHLAYRPDESEEDQHVEIPGLYVKLMRRKTGGTKNMLARFGLVG